MSLLDVMKEKFNVMDKVTEPDGMGGFVSVYREGAEFEAVVEITNSISEETAKAQGVSGVYDVTVSRNIKLEFPMIIKRKRDGQTFRITSAEGSDTPSSSALDIRKVRAERFIIPNE